MGMEVKTGGSLWRTVWEGRGIMRLNTQHWADRLKAEGFEVRRRREDEADEYRDKVGIVQVRGNRDVQMRAMSWLPRNNPVVPQWWHDDPYAAEVISRQIKAEIETKLKDPPTHVCSFCGNLLPYNPHIPGYYCKDGCGLQKNYRLGAGPTAMVAATDEDPPF